MLLWVALQVSIELTLVVIKQLVLMEAHTSSIEALDLGFLST